MSLGSSRRIAAAAVAGLAATAVVLAAAAPALADQVRNREWWLANLHVPTAWQSSRGGGVTVAVLDTGVDAQQPDLAGAVISGPDFTASGRKPGGPYWGVHGTVVASLIAGRGHGPGNRDGIIGVAPAAQILSVRVTLEQTDPLLAKPAIAQGLPGAIAHGIRYAVNHRASVIDLPLDPVTTPGAPGAGGSPAEQAAVNYALRHNVVLVAPAGDGGAGTDPVNYPAAYPGVVAVGAFDSTYTKPAFTTHHAYVTVTAPGVNMIAATPGGYAPVSTTAAASAVVSGIVALIRAQDPGLSPAQVTKVLERSTVYRPGAGRVPGSGFGTVDAGLAILAAARMDKNAPAATPAPSPVASTVSRAPVAAPSPAPAAASTPGGSLLLVGLIGAVVGIVLLVGAVLLLMQIRRRRARAARLAPIRLAAQLQPRRAALPAGEGPPPGGADANAERIAATTSAAFAPRADARVSGEPPWATSPWPPAAPAGGTPGSAVVPWSTAGQFAGADPAAGQFAGAGPAAGQFAGAGPGAPAAGAPGAGAPATGAAADSGAGSPAAGGALVPAGPGSGRLPPRGPAARTQKVAGAPPWEPAAKPETELPWTASPPRRGGSAANSPPLPQRRPQPPPASPWDALAEAAWPGGGPAAGRRPEAGTGKPASGDAAGTGAAGITPALTAGDGGGDAGTAAGAGAGGTSGAAGPAAGLTGLAAARAGAAAGRAAAVAGAGAGGNMPDEGRPEGLWAGAASEPDSGAGAAEGPSAPPWPPAAPWPAPGGNPDTADGPGHELFVDFGPPPGASGNGAAADGPAGNGLLSAGLPEPGYGWYGWNPGDVTESFPTYRADDG